MAKKSKKTTKRSKMTDKELRTEASKVAHAITLLNAVLRDLTFEMGVREDKVACLSDDPDRMCSYCTCWKMTRAKCS
jgi:hypothetical protein